MKIYLDVRNVCHVETDNGNIYELYDTGKDLEICLRGIKSTFSQQRMNMRVSHVNLADDIKLGDYDTIKLRQGAK